MDEHLKAAFEMFSADMGEKSDTDMLSALSTICLSDSVIFNTVMGTFHAVLDSTRIGKQKEFIVILMDAYSKTIEEEEKILH